MQLRREAYPVTTICHVLGLHAAVSIISPGVRRMPPCVCCCRIWRHSTRPCQHRLEVSTKRREGWPVNRKRVQRLMAEMGLQRRVKPRSRRTTDSRHAFWRYPNLVAGMDVTYPDQVWVAEMVYSQMTNSA